MLERMVFGDLVGALKGMDMKVTRRALLLATGGALAFPRFTWAQPSSVGLLGAIERQVLWDNRDGKTLSWFHPRADVIPRNGQQPLALMTLQEIAGSDYFGPVHWTSSEDNGRTWTPPAPIPSFGRQPVSGHPGLEVGVCDVVPEYHPQTKTVLAMGHNVYYRGPKFSKGDQLARYPVYSVRAANGDWSELRKLVWDDPRGGEIYSNGCGQRVVEPDGDILMSLTFGTKGEPRAVAGVRCRFDGQQLTITEVGPALENRQKRGLLEPSVTRFGDRVYMTIRAEDDRGYVASSRDGIHYGDKRAWTWDDGEPLSLSTTQQHWLTHSDGLFLVYTRKDPSNLKVIRWRAPLYVAQVDPDRLVLIRETEQVVLPLDGDGLNAPNEVPLMGNFHVTNVSPEESWVTVGSWLPRHQARGATHLARIRWTRPNQLV